MLLLGLVDILLILLVAGLLFPFLSENKDTDEIVGYSFRINAYREGEWVHVNVLVEQSEGAEHSDEEGVREEGKMEILFAPSGGSVRERHLLVPPRENDPQIMRSRFKALEAAQVTATVHFAGRQLELETGISERE